MFADCRFGGFACLCSCCSAPFAIVPLIPDLLFPLLLSPAFAGLLASSAAWLLSLPEREEEREGVNAQSELTFFCLHMLSFLFSPPFEISKFVLLLFPTCLSILLTQMYPYVRPPPSPSLFVLLLCIFRPLQSVDGDYSNT